MNKTGIEYLDYTWNPLAMRCTRVSPGCRECWHLRFANRLSANPKIPTDVRAAYAGESPPLLVGARLDEPYSVRNSSAIGVQFMGDLFHEDVPLETIRQIYAVMWMLGDRHTFYILTKRPQRTLEYYEWYDKMLKAEFWSDWDMEKELAHVRVGITAENQAAADERIPLLLQIQAAFHFMSCEPLLGEIDLQYWLDYDASTGSAPALDLVIAGAETGPGKRPMRLDDARSLRDQCQAAGTPFFFKRDSEGNRELDGRLWEEMPS